MADGVGVGWGYEWWMELGWDGDMSGGWSWGGMGCEWWMELGWDGDMGVDGGEMAMRIRMGNGGGVGRGYGGQSVAGGGGGGKNEGMTRSTYTSP